MNWRNPAVQQAMFQVVRFWLDRGVDGFRLDAVSWLGKDVRWPDNPGRWSLSRRIHVFQVHRYDRDLPEAHDVMRDVRRVVDAYPDKVLVGETAHDTRAPALYYGAGSDELHLVFNFQMLHARWNADTFRRIVNQWDAAVPEGGWPTLVLSNHDFGRHASRLRRGVNRETASRRNRTAALLLLTLRGSPFLYYGEELGMADCTLRYKELRDPLKRYWPFFAGRDGARTPMQWNDTAHAGFTDVEPWLPVHPDYSLVNVAREDDDPASLLSLYRRLIHLRRRSPALTVGDYQEVPIAADCLVYRRTAPDERILVIVNFGPSVRQRLDLPTVVGGTLLFSTGSDVAGQVLDSAPLRLAPEEGLVIRLEPKIA